MATLIFDIKTIADTWESFDEKAKVSLTNQVIQSAANNTDNEKELERLKSQLSFSPLTGSIVALSMYDVERMLGATYCVGSCPGEASVEGDFTYKERTEKELLEDFWEGARSYDVFVTFNGRAFAIPFLLHRSVVHNVMPTVDLLSSRYLTKQSLPYQVDLLDELTFYGAMKRQSLRIFCRAYGIDVLEEVEGEEEVVSKSISDVIAVTELYKKWKKYLAPASFINAIEL